MRVLAPLSLLLALAPPSATPGPADPGVWRGLVSTSYAPALNRCVPNVNSAINALNARGTASGFHYAGTPALDGLFRHFQGITRLPHSGGTWLAVSRSGSAQAVAIVGPNGVVSEITAPEGLTHAGGIQALGEILAVPYEHKGGRSAVLLYDVTDASHPRVIYELDRSEVPAPSEAGHASAVALTRLADGRVAMIVGVHSSKVLDLYVSNQSDLAAPGLEFNLVATLANAVEGRFQSQNLVTQCDGSLFLIGTYNNGFPGPRLGADMIRWYRLSQNASGAVQLEAQGKRKVTCTYCNFGAAAGVYVAPAGDLMLYGIEHRDTGPNRTVYYEEFRTTRLQSGLPSGG
jgi:hypothetical protein